MARGALKGLKRNRPAPGEKGASKGQVSQGLGGRLTTQGNGGGIQHGGATNSNGTTDLDGVDLVSWLNCECFFSLVLVGLLAALPFNLHTQELMQTPETYVARAVELSGEGSWDKAATLYERAVNTEETAERHELLADALVHSERKEEALWHYGRAINLYVDDKESKVSTLMSLGKVQTEEGLTEDAVQTYLQVLELQRGQEDVDLADAHFQVARSLLDNNDHSRALAHLEIATGFKPNFSKALQLLAHTLRDMGWVEEAVTLYKAITSQRPTDISTLVQLGFAYHELCDFSHALDMYKKAHSSPPKAAEMEYLSAALHGHTFRPPRTPSAYISDLFDLEARKTAYLQNEGAGTTEAGTGGDVGAGDAGGNGGGSSGQPIATGDTARGARGTTQGRAMFYDVHGLIFDRVAPNMRSMIEAALGLETSSAEGKGREQLQWLDVLDLGCGRGRMGEELRLLANRMTGVDLSSEAVKHAMRLGIYDHVKQGDILAFAKGMQPQSVDVIVAADVFPYFGDLSDLLRAMAAATRSGGLIAFNTDVVDGDMGDSNGVRAAAGEAQAGVSSKGYELRFTGRWSHRRKYVVQMAATAGLTILGVRAVKGWTPVISHTPGQIVLEASPQERRTFVYLLQA